MMQTWTYPARIEACGPDEFVVTFRTVPEAITSGACFDEAVANAEDALEEAVLGYLADGRTAPPPSPVLEGETAILLDPVTAARAALAQAMQDRQVTNVALAEALGKSEGAIRRLVDGTSSVKISTVLEALRRVGSKAALATQPI